MNKIYCLFILVVFLTNCSLNKNSSFWTSETIQELEAIKFEKIFDNQESLGKELNPSLNVNLSSQIISDKTSKQLHNNDGRVNFNGTLKKSSKYKFSKIKNFYQFEPTISFNKDNVIFFDNKGTILQFDKSSKLVWKKNYYSKLEKKLNPILQFANNGKFLIVADSIAKYFMIDLKSGNLIWSKNSLAPFNSQIQIYKDKFFIVDFTNTLRCFSLENGKEIWNIKTDTSLIRSQKKLSIVIIDNTIYFNNSIGDVSAADINSGELLWQLPTQSNLIYESAFSLETSDIITDKNYLYFSNNNNQFYSVDIRTGNFKWQNKVNSSLRPTLIQNYLFSISIEGYLVIIDKITGNIIKVTDIFDNFNQKKRNEIKPTGFIVGLKNIYLSTNNGRLLVIDIKSGKTIKTLKIDSDKISRPFVLNANLFLIKDDAIIKLN